MYTFNQYLPMSDLSPHGHLTSNVLTGVLAIIDNLKKCLKKLNLRTANKFKSNQVKEMT